MVVDYRPLNKSTVFNSYPIPLISQIFNNLSKAKFFTKLDLVGAYQLLRIGDGCEHLVAFGSQYGMYKSPVIRNELRNAPAVFQHFLNDTFCKILGKGVTIYIDDVTTPDDLEFLHHSILLPCESDDLIVPQNHG